MVEKYQEQHHGAGWVWAIVGIIVAALVVWWVAAAVSDPSDDRLSAQGVRAPENANVSGHASGDQVAQVSDEQNPVKDPAQAVDQISGADASANAKAQGDGADLASLNQWTGKERSDIDASALDDATAYLSGAAREVLSAYPGAQPQPGSQMGGGPPEDTVQLSAQQQRLEASVQELKEVKSNDYPEAFYQVATDFVALVDGVQERAELEEAREPLAQLHDALGELSAQRALEDQKQALSAFFDRGAEVLNQFAQSSK